MTVSVSMPSVWLRCITSFCFFFTVLSGKVSSGVIWKDVGGHITIQCRCPEPDQDQDYLALKKGLQEDFEVLYKVKEPEKNTIHTQFSGRLQLNGVMPNVDIFITNLTLDDTGPYWCVYKKFHPESSETKTIRGTGSVLLVVTDSTTQQCDPPNKSLILGSVVISAAVLLGIILAFFVWLIHKSKTSHSSQKPRRVATNDVYEDMRGTLRR